MTKPWSIATLVLAHDLGVAADPDLRVIVDGNSNLHAAPNCPSLVYTTAWDTTLATWAAPPPGGSETYDWRARYRAKSCRCFAAHVTDDPAFLTTWGSWDPSMYNLIEDVFANHSAIGAHPWRELQALRDPRTLTWEASRHLMLTVGAGSNYALLRQLRNTLTWVLAAGDAHASTPPHPAVRAVLRALAERSEFLVETDTTGMAVRARLCAAATAAQATVVLRKEKLDCPHAKLLLDLFPQLNSHGYRRQSEHGMDVYMQAAETFLGPSMWVVFEPARKVIFGTDAALLTHSETLAFRRTHLIAKLPYQLARVADLDADDHVVALFEAHEGDTLQDMEHFTSMLPSERSIDPISARERLDAILAARS